MPRKTVARLLLACTLAVSALAQTAAEQLQKGIFAQDTQGKLDDAIAIYRQIAGSSTTPRDTAAQAQYRLAQALLQKGDIPNATRAFEQLERAFPDSGQLIGQLASRLPPPSTPAAGDPFWVQRLTQVRKALETGGPIAGTPIKEYGKITSVLWMNPLAVLKISTATKEYQFILSSPNQLVQQGLTRPTLKLGDMVTIIGILLDASTTDNGFGLANTVELASNGQVVFDRAKVQSQPAPAPIAGEVSDRSLAPHITAVVLGSGPAVIRKVGPQYSEAARKARYQGQVTIAARVDERGLPTNLRVVKRLGLGLDENAMEAIGLWKFEITMKDGKPAPTEIMVQVDYRLDAFIFIPFSTSTSPPR